MARKIIVGVTAGVSDPDVREILCCPCPAGVCPGVADGFN